MIKDVDDSDAQTSQLMTGVYHLFDFSLFIREKTAKFYTGTEKLIKIDFKIKSDAVAAFLSRYVNE